MATGGNLARSRPLSTILADTKPEANRKEEKKDADVLSAGDDKERTDPLPRPGTPYKAHAMYMPLGGLMTLFLVGPDYLPDGFAYADLRRARLVASPEPGKGPVLLLDFSDAEVKIEGRGIDSLCYLIGMHLMPWIWQHPSPGDFTDEGATLIRKITVSLKER